MLNHNNDKGSTILEVVIAMAILSMVLVSIFMFYTLIIRGEETQKRLEAESIAINSFCDEIKSEIKNTSCNDVRECVQEINQNYPMFTTEVVEIENGLYKIDVKGKQGVSGQNAYTIKVYHQR